MEQKNKKNTNEKWIWKIFFVGVVVQCVFLVFADNKRETITISFLIVMLAFFMAVYLIFRVADKAINRGYQISVALKKATEEINKMDFGDEAEALEKVIKTDVLFEDESLDKVFLEFKKDIHRMSFVSQKTKINIEDYINYEFIDDEIKTSYLSLVSGTMTGLGILGTFVGLSMGLNSFNVSGTADEVLEKIGPLMNGIKVAFHTSICGLIYSLLYNYCHRKFYAELQESLEEFLDTFENKVISNVNNGSSHTFVGYQERLCGSMEVMVQLLQNQNIMMGKMSGQITDEVSKQMQEVIVPSLEKMSNSIETFACNAEKNQVEGVKNIVDSFITQMNSTLGNSFTELGKIIEETNIWQKKSLEELQNILNQIGNMAVDLATINNGIENAIGHVEKYSEQVTSVQDQLAVNLMNLNVQTDINNQSLEKQIYILEQMLLHEQKADESMKQFAEDISKQNVAMREMVDEFDTYTKTISSEMTTRMSEIQSVALENLENVANTSAQNIGVFTNDISSCINAVGDKFEKQGQRMEETMSKFGDNISDQNTVVKNMVNDFDIYMQNQLQGMTNRLLDIEKFASASMEKTTETAANNINTIGVLVQNKIREMEEINKDMVGDINKAAIEISNASQKYSDQMIEKIKGTFNTFDKELAEIVSHFSGTIVEMEKILKSTDGTVKKIPFQVNTSCSEMEEIFRQLQIKLDQYLEYADKLHHNIELKWNQWNTIKEEE